VDPDQALAEVLVAGQQAGQARIEELAKGGGDATGGWSSALHAFDYNLDHLGLGTIDAPEWKIADRYSIGDRTPGLRAGQDGSVTIYLQRDPPGSGKEANWLPTPARAFRPTLRMYQPQPPILDGTYVLPAIAKVG
jgi:hypothetical protein